MTWNSVTTRGMNVCDLLFSQTPSLQKNKKLQGPSREEEQNKEKRMRINAREQWESGRNTAEMKWHEWMDGRSTGYAGAGSTMTLMTLSFVHCGFDSSG